MKFHQISFLLMLFISFSNLFAQEDSWTENKKDWTEESNSSSKFFVGINAGALFVNSNTAAIYRGTSDITAYGINYILSVPNYKTVLDPYFQYPYAVSEYPKNPTYKTALDVGLHAGMNLGKGNAIFIDINSATLKYEDVFTIAIDKPSNQTTDSTYEQIPIFGKEKRFNLNLGTQIALLNTEKTIIYWPIFGNFNSIKLERNYIVINSQEYEIIHSNIYLSTSEPGGIGYGLGSGIG